MLLFNEVFRRQYQGQADIPIRFQISEVRPGMIIIGISAEPAQGDPLEYAALAYVGQIESSLEEYGVEFRRNRRGRRVDRLLVDRAGAKFIAPLFLPTEVLAKL